MSYLVGAGYHLSVSINEHFALPQNDISALSTDDSSTTVANTPLSQCLRLIPQSRLLLSSCSPLHTPQNIPDAHMRDSKNEPSNFEFIVSAVAPYIDLQPEALAMLNLTNSMAVYHLKSEDSNSVCASANVSAGISASTDSTGGNSGEIHSNASVSEVPLSGLTLAGIHLDDNSSYSTISSATVGATGSNSQSQQQLMCSKCHHILFSQTHLIHQHVSGSNTVLLEAPSATESTTVEHCTAVYFLPVTLLGCCSGSYVDSLSVDSSSNVSCSHCSTKLGKQIVTRNDDSGVGVVSSCPCGYEIRQDNAEFSSFEGGLLRLTSTKIKPVVHSSSTCTNSDTSSRAAVERELQPYRKDRSKSTANESEDDLPHVALSGKAGKRGKQGKKK